MTTRPRIESPSQHATMHSRHKTSVQRLPAPASGPAWFVVSTPCAFFAASASDSFAGPQQGILRDSL